MSDKKIYKGQERLDIGKIYKNNQSLWIPHKTLNITITLSAMLLSAQEPEVLLDMKATMDILPVMLLSVLVPPVSVSTNLRSTINTNPLLVETPFPVKKPATTNTKSTSAPKARSQSATRSRVPPRSSRESSLVTKERLLKARLSRMTAACKYCYIPYVFSSYSSVVME
jgi:hypothetical protein